MYLRPEFVGNLTCMYHESFLKFPNAVVLNVVGRKKTQLLQHLSDKLYGLGVLKHCPGKLAHFPLQSLHALALCWLEGIVSIFAPPPCLPCPLDSLQTEPRHLYRRLWGDDILRRLRCISGKLAKWPSPNKDFKANLWLQHG